MLKSELPKNKSDIKINTLSNTLAKEYCTKSNLLTKSEEEIILDSKILFKKKKFFRNILYSDK